MVLLGMLTLLPDPRLTLSSRLCSSVVFGLVKEEAQFESAEGESKRVAWGSVNRVGDSWAVDSRRVETGERVVACGVQLLWGEVLTTCDGIVGLGELTDGGD